jgi:hypothetical protein
MTELQFDILDELYFVIEFEDLSNQSGIARKKLIPELRKMLEKGWIKVFEGEIELEPDKVSPDDDEFVTYRFLASKKGLFAHNSK